MSGTGLLTLTSNLESHSDVHRVVTEAVADSLCYSRPAPEAEAVAARQTAPSPSDVSTRWQQVLSNAGGHLRVPLPWFSGLTRPYRGGTAPDLDAILVLAYVVGRFVIGDTEGPGVLYAGVDMTDGRVVADHRSIDLELGMSPARRKVATRTLAERGLLTRIVVKGTVPWWSEEARGVGSYLFLIPNVQAVESL